MMLHILADSSHYLDPATMEGLNICVRYLNEGRIELWSSSITTRSDPSRPLTPVRGAWRWQHAR